MNAVVSSICTTQILV